MKVTDLNSVNIYTMYLVVQLSAFKNMDVFSFGLHINKVWQK